MTPYPAPIPPPPFILIAMEAYEYAGLAGVRILWQYVDRPQPYWDFIPYFATEQGGPLVLNKVLPPAKKFRA